MFDIGWSELMVVAVVALVVIGPRDLPAALRTLGRMIGQVKRMASDFQGQFNEALREAELDGLRQEIQDLKRATSGALAVPDLNAPRPPLSSQLDDRVAAAGVATAMPLVTQLPDSSGEVTAADAGVATDPTAFPADSAAPAPEASQSSPDGPAAHPLEQSERAL